MSSAIASGLLGLVLLGLAAPVSAQEPGRAAEQLMRKSGMWKQLEAVPAQVHSGLSAAAEKDRGRVPETELQRLRGAVDVAFAPQRLQASALRVVAAGLRASDAPSLLRWYDSPLGQGITRLEEAAATPDRDPRRAMREGSAIVARATPARSALLGQLVEVTRTPEFMANLTVSTALAVHRGVNASMPPGQPPTTNSGDLAATLRAQRPQMMRAFAELSLALYASAYETLPDADLRRYVDFLKSPAGARFTALGMRGFEAALGEGSAAFGRAIPQPRDGAKT